MTNLRISVTGDLLHKLDERLAAERRANHDQTISRANLARGLIAAGLSETSAGDGIAIVRGER